MRKCFKEEAVTSSFTCANSPAGYAFLNGTYIDTKQIKVLK